MSRVSMLVAETGTDWSAWIHACGRDSDDVVVVAQGARETNEAFSRRVRDRMRTLNQDGAWPDRVALLGNRAWDGPSLGCRASLLRSLARGLARGPRRARVYLDAPASDTAGSRARHGICALAWAASEEARGTGVSIQVRKATEVAAEARLS